MAQVGVLEWHSMCVQNTTKYKIYKKQTYYRDSQTYTNIDTQLSFGKIHIILIIPQVHGSISYI